MGARFVWAAPLLFYGRLLMSDTFLQQFEEKRAARLAADRTFTLAGETLTYRPSVPPQVGLKLEEARHRVAVEVLEISQLAESIKAPAKNGASGDSKPDQSLIPPEFVRLLSGQTTDSDILQIADETIVACLEPDSLEGWGRLRAEDAAYPLSISEVMEIADWLIGKVTGTPTDAPADFSAGREKTASRSKGSSSSTGRTRTG